MNRTDILNDLASATSARRYLEIGVENTNSNFNHVKVLEKIGVDPNPNAKATFVGTSDDFFDSYSGEKFDLIFIDGLHIPSQVLRDIRNSIKNLNDNGSILLHDMMPTSPEQTTEHHNGGAWTGPVWRAMLALQTDLEFCNNFQFWTINTDWGCSLIRRGSTNIIKDGVPELITMSYWQMSERRTELMHVVSSDHFKTVIVPSIS